ncbi:peptidoglycan-binding domain-containing protein [Neptuniibacter sp. SY11_33]|uniref:peptidoglycan-binding domain-containing protein n=1 Tax=Neptuniibacter sp. SY11_33 TaxID=3398215 RepID=UPI0039F516E3
MVITTKGAAKLSLISSAILLAACSASNPQQSPYSAAELEQRNQALLEREKAVSKREAQAQDAVARSQAGGDELLPPNAKAGECYARVWVEPTYQNYTEQMLVKEESEKVDIIPARFEKVTEQLLVQPAGVKMVAVPAKYETVTEQKLVREAGTEWLVALNKGSAPASSELLKAAANHGINLNAATPGMCFHEHYLPAKFEQVNESVLVQEAYDVVETVPAEYRWVEKKVLVKEASSRIEQVPAQYSSVSEQVVDVPAHTTWKKGTGPIQKIDEATGEIMCLVEVPATYKTITKRVLASPATTRTVEIPAVYKTVKVKELVSEAREIRKTIPAKYKDVAVTKKVADVGFTWHEVHNHEHPASTRTGNQICLTEHPAQYKTITRQVVAQEATTKKIEIPAKYETVTVTKEVSAASEKRTVIPAEYKTVSLSKIDKAGFMEWRSILCETNMTQATIMDIQRALAAKGYNPGQIDGVVGSDTMSAVNNFQRDEKLPTDKYINIDTVKALGVGI